MRPFVKWPGGKAQLLPELQRRMPQHIGTYAEPFVGGGALFYNTRHTKALLNDANPKLMNLYINVRDHKSELAEKLASYESEYNTLTTIGAKQDFYYQSRSIFNARDFEINLTVQDAARFVFINKTCFNGLYRENKAGLFNAAFGWKSNIILYDEDNLTDCSSALQDVVIMSGDFEDACQNLTAGDFYISTHLTTQPLTVIKAADLARRTKPGFKASFSVLLKEESIACSQTTTRNSLGTCTAAIALRWSRPNA